jgi:hypothetical protein
MNLTDLERETLRAMRAIKIDSAGAEVLVGLSEAESEEYLALSRRSDAGELGIDHPRFLQLQTKHEAERQEIIDGRKPLD